MLTPRCRALAALPIAVGGAILVFLCVPPLARAAGIQSDLGFNLLGNTLWLLLGIAGALLLRLRLRFGPPGRSVAALAGGSVAFTLALSLAALLGHAVMAAAPRIAPLGFLAATGGLFLGATAEEVLFRGFLQPLLVHAWGRPAAVIVAAAGFTLVHVVGGWSAPLTLVNVMLAGIWFGLIALRTGGFGGALLAHAGWNWTEALLFGVVPNPGHDPAGSVIDIDLGGAAWLGGSGDGMNSALPTTLVLAMLIAPLLIGRRREPEPPAFARISRDALPELRP